MNRKLSYHANYFIDENPAFKRFPAPLYRSLARLASAAAVCAALVAAQTARGATKTWIGSSGAKFSVGANWLGGVAPVSGDSLVFGLAGTSGPLLNNDLTDASFAVAGFTFNAGADAFVIGDGTTASNVGAFNLTGSILNSGANIETINNAFSLGVGTLSFTTSAGGGDLVLGGVISGTSAITKAGVGALSLTQANTYSGTTTLTTGQLNLNASGTGITNSALGTSSLVLGTGVILDNTSAGDVTLSTSNAISIAAAGSFGFGGSGNLNLGAGTLSSGFSQSIYLNGTSSKTLTVQNWTNTVANLADTFFTVPDSSTKIKIGVFNAQSVSGTNGTTTILGNSTISITGGIQPTNVATAFSYSGTGTLTLTGASSYTGATLFNAGTVILDARAGVASLNSSTSPTFAGGTFIFKGDNAGTSQGFQQLTMSPGGSSLQVVGGGSLGTTVSFTSISSGAVASMLNIQLSGTSPLVTTTTLAGADGILGARGSITVTIGNTTEFAGKSGTSNIIQYTGQTPFTGTTTGTATNYSLVGSQTLTAATTPNTFRITSSGASQSLDLSDYTMKLTSGGLLFTGSAAYEIKGNSGANLSSFTNNTVPDLVLHNFGTGGLNISAIIANGGLTGQTVTQTLSVDGPGVTTLSGINIYTGTTYISGGATVNILANSGLGAVGTGAALTLNNGTLQAGAASLGLYNGAATSNARNITLAAGGGIFDTQSFDMTVAGVISGSGSLTKKGSGTLTLDGINSYNGGFTNIQNGTLILGTKNAALVGTLTSATLLVLGSGSDSGVLQLGDASNSAPVNIAGLFTSGSGTANAIIGGNATANSVITFGGNASAPSTFSGTLGGGTATSNRLALTVSSGSLTLSGSNTYTGLTTVSGGVLTLGSTTALNGGNAVTTATGGVLDINGNDVTLGLLTNGSTVINGGISKTLTIGAGSIGAGSFTGAMNLTFNQGASASSITGTTLGMVGDLTLNATGAGTIGFTTANNVGLVINSGGGGGTTTVTSVGANVTEVDESSTTSALTVTQLVVNANGTTLKNTTGTKILNITNQITGTGSLILQNNSATGSAIVINGGAANGGPIYNYGTNGGSVSIPGIITAAVTGIVQDGNSTLILGGANLFTGPVTVTSGTVRVTTSNTALGTSAGGVLVGNGGALDLNIGVAGEAITINGPGVNGSGALLNSSGTAVGVTGPITLGSASTISDFGTVNGTLALSGGINNGGFLLTLDGTYGNGGSQSGSITVAGISGAGGLTKNGVGTWQIGVANTYGGTTTINAGVFYVAGFNGSLPSGTPLTFSGTSLFVYDNNSTISGNMRTQTLGAGTYNAGDDSLKILRNGASTTQFVNLASQTRAVGATVNYIITSGASTGSPINSAAYAFTVGGLTLNHFIDQGTFYSPSLANAGVIADFAFNDNTNFIRGINYGVSGTGGDLNSYATTVAGVSSIPNGYLYVKTLGKVSGQLSQAGQLITSLNIAGVNSLAGSNDFILANAVTLTIDGILRSSTVSSNLSAAATISGGAALQAEMDKELVIRADNTLDALSISTNIISNGTNSANGANALTKSGIGQVLLYGANSYTGGTYVNAGVLSFGNKAAQPVTGAVSVLPTATLALGVSNSPGTTYFSVADFDTLYSTGVLPKISIAALSGVGLDTSAGNVTYGTALAGTRGLVKVGANTLTLTGASTYTGTNTFFGGTVALSGAGTLGATTNPLILDGAALDLGGTTQTTGLVTINVPALSGVTISNGTINAAAGYSLSNIGIGNVIINANIGGGGLVKSPTGLLTLGGVNTITSITSSGPVVFTNPLALPSNGTFAGLSSGSSTNDSIDLAYNTDAASPFRVSVGVAPSTFLVIYSDVAAGGDGVGVNHNLGTLVFSNLLSGTFFIQRGANVTSGNPSITLASVSMTASSVLNPTTASVIVGPVTVSTATVANSLTLGGTAIGNSVGSITQISTAIPTSLIKSGTSTWKLNGTNTYSAGTSLSGGTVQLDYTTLNTSKLGGSGAGALTLGGVTLELQGGSYVEIVPSTVLTAGTANFITRTSATSVLQLGTLSAGASSSVNFAGDNIAKTTSANSAGGILGAWATVTNGTVTDFATNSGGNIVALGTYSDVNNFAGTIANSANSNVRIIDGGASGNITLGNGSNTTLINTLKTKATGVARITNAGTLSVGDDTGGTILQDAGAGTLTIGDVANEGFLTTGAAANANPVSLRLQNNSLTNNLVVNSVIANNGASNIDLVSLAVNGLGTVVLVGTNTFSGSTTINAGTLQIGSGLTTGALAATGTITDNSALVFNRSDVIVQGTAFSTAAITGTGSVTQIGSGTLTLNAANTFSGGLTIKNGTVSATTSATALGGATGTVTLGDTTVGQGATLLIGALTYANPITLTSGSTGTLTLGSSITGGIYSGGVTGSNNLTITNGFASLQFTTAALANTGSITSNGGTSASVTTISVPITAASSVTQSGPGTLALSALNTYTGVTTISAGAIATGTLGTLVNGGLASSLGQSSNAAMNLVINGGILTYTNNGATAGSTDRLFTLGEKGGSLDASGTSAITYAGNGTGAANALAYVNSGARTLTLTGTNTGTNTFAPIIADGTGGVTNLNKAGAGSWTVSGANTYTGTTSVTAGTLNLTGSNNTVSATTLTAGTLNLGTGNAIGSGLFTFTAGTLVNTSGAVLTLQNNPSILLGTSGSTTTIGAAGSTSATNLNFGTGSISLTAASTSRIFALLGTGTTSTFGGTLTNNSGVNFSLTANGVGNTLALNSIVEGSGTTTLTLTGTANFTVKGPISNGGTANPFTYSGSGTLTVSGMNSYTGATTSSGVGTMVLDGSSGGSIGASIVTATAGASGVLQVKGNYSIGTATAGSLVVTGGLAGSQGRLSLVDGSANTLSLLNNTSAPTTLTIGNATSTNNSVLNLEVGATSDQIALASTAKLAVGTSTLANQVNITGLGNLSGTQQTLISAPGGTTTVGALSKFALGTTSGNFGGRTVSLANDTTHLYLNETTAASAGPTVFWTGFASGVVSQGGSFAWNSFTDGNANNSNFATNAAGTTNAAGLIDSTTAVTFNASGNVVAGSAANTILGQDFTIASLTFRTSETVGIGGSDTLTINGDGAGDDGVLVESGAGNDTISAKVNMGGNLTWRVTDAANVLTVSNTISGTGKSLTKEGAGTLVLSGLNNFTGATNVKNGTLTVSGGLTATSALNVSGGTLLLGASDVLNDAPVNLSGGTLSTGGFSDSVGVLTLTANSTLDFGSGSTNSQLLFAGVGANANNATLWIINWNVVSTSTDHLFFSGNASTFMAQFDQNEVSFNGQFGYATYQLGNQFEVTAVPEPSVLAMSTLLLGLAGFRERRRFRRVLSKK